MKKYILLNIFILLFSMQLFASGATITSFSPSSGTTGTGVFITGTGFTGATAVKFGGVNATNYTVLNNTTIYAVVPATSSGSIEVINGNTATLSGFTYNSGLTAVATAPTVGNGTVGNPYQIGTLENLYWLATTTSVWTGGKYFIQTANIDATSTSIWTAGIGLNPIGNNTTSFQGHYNGQGFSINNLYIKSGNYFVALFGRIDSGGTISNLNLTNEILISQSSNDIGGFVAQIYGTSSITNCSVNGGFGYGPGLFGGFVGDIGNSTITNCSTDLTIFATSSNAGGFVSYLGTGGNIENSYCKGYINGTSYVGGFVGNPIAGNISNCYAKKNVVGTNICGGFLPYSNSATTTISNCYALGTVNCPSFVGGFGGYNSSNIVFSSCFWDTSISGLAYGFGNNGSQSGVTGKTTAEMTTQYTFTGWDFVGETTNGTNDYWRISATNNDGYPYLSWQYFPSPPTITSFTPSSGASGTSVTITGTGFSGITGITIGSVAVTNYTVNSLTSITLTVPSGTVSGLINITNSLGTGTSATMFMVPIVYDIMGAGNTIVNGTYIQSSSTNDGVPYYVKSGTPTMYLYRYYDFYNGTSWAIASTLNNNDPLYFTMSSAQSPSSINFTYNNGTTGIAPNPITSSQNPNHYLVSGAGTTNANGYYTSYNINDNVPYFIKKGSPSMYLYRYYDFYNGSTWAIDNVLNNSDPAYFKLFSSPATPSGLTLNYNNGITGTSPNPSISITNPIYEITPSSGSIGTTITIKGSYFTDVTSVTIGGIAVSSYSVVDINTITAVVASGNSGMINVVTPSSTRTSLGLFTLTSPPTINSFTPSSGASGTSVTITGTGFSGITGITIGSVAVTNYTVNSLTSITLTVPSGTISGLINITNSLGTGTSATMFIVPNTWTGTTSSSWSTASNWSLNAVPTTSDNIVISSGTNAPILDVDITIPTGKSLTISGTGTLTVAPGKTLTIAGSADFGGKAVTFKSDATGTAMLGTLTGTLTGASNVTVERFIPSGKRAFRLLSPAVTTTNFISGNWQQQTHITGGASGGFDATETNNPSMFTYNNQAASGTGWTAIANTNATNLTAGVGYRILVRGDRTASNITAASADSMNTAVTLSATGTLRTGTVTLNSSSTPSINNTSNTTTADYSLIGNPYQSAVDWNAVTKSGIDATYWAWDPNMGTTAQRGRYVSFNGTVNSVDGGVGSSNVGQFIQPGQAFFVKNTTTGAAGTLTFEEVHKATTNANVFRTANPTTLTVSLYDPNELAIGGYPIDATKAVFSAEYSNELGLGDAAKLEAAGENIAWYRNNTKLAIEAAAPASSSDELVMKTIRLGANKNYTFKINTTNFDADLTPYLVDNFLNTQTQISTSEVYLANFITTNNVASYGEDRFKIVFQTSALSTDDFANNIKLYPNPAKAGASFYLDGITEATVSVYNVVGQNIPVSVMSQGNATQVTPKTALNQGVYLVTITTAGKTAQVKWIVE